MAQADVEAVKRAVEARNRRDVDALLDELHPEVEWYDATPMMLGGDETVFRGHEGIRELQRELDEVLGDIQIELSEVRDLGDRVLGIGRLNTRGMASGAEIDSPYGVLAHIENGKATRVQSYLDVEAALRGAGLSD